MAFLLHTIWGTEYLICPLLFGAKPSPKSYENEEKNWSFHNYKNRNIQDIHFLRICSKCAFRIFLKLWDYILSKLLIIHHIFHKTNQPEWTRVNKMQQDRQVFKAFIQVRMTGNLVVVQLPIMLEQHTWEKLNWFEALGTKMTSIIQPSVRTTCR